MASVPATDWAAGETEARTCGRSGRLPSLLLLLSSFASIGANCEDPPPPPRMGAFILGARTVMPPADERVLRGGRRETLERFEGLHVIATSIRVVHRTDRNDPSTERVVELESGRQELELVGRLDDPAPRLLAFLNVPEGYVFQIRVVIESATLTLDGSAFDVHLPSIDRSGYKIEPIDGEPFEIVAGERSAARVIFNPFEELIGNRGRGFILDPRVDAERVPLDELLGFAADRVVVGFDPALTREQIDAINAVIGTSVIRCWRATNYCVLHLPIDVSIQAALEHYLPRGDVRFALPDTLVATTADPPPFDPAYVLDQQPRFLDARFYQPSAEPGAWDIETGSHEVVVAVIDSGLNLNHPDIIENIWINEAEIPPAVLAAAGGRDALANAAGPDGVITFADLDAVVARLRDDGDPATDPDTVCAVGNTFPFERCNPSDLVNGNPGSAYGWQDGVDGDPLPGCPDVCAVDDVVGWDFDNGHNRPLDSSGHGTNMASIIGAVGSNGMGMAGAAWRVRLMIIEYEGLGFGPDEVVFRGFRSSILLALHYAVANGAHIANISSVGLARSDPFFDCGLFPTFFLEDDEKMRETRRLLLEEIRDVDLSGIVLVAAAGNCAPIVGQDFDLDRGDLLSWPAVLGGANGADLPSMIRVANFGNGGDLAENSAFGLSFVDIATPGVDHIALNFRYPDEFGEALELRGRAVGHPSIDGTSPAAAMTSGLAALVLSRSPELRGDGCRAVDRILRSARPEAAIEDRIPDGRVLDALAAVRDDRRSPVRSCP